MKQACRFAFAVALGLAGCGGSAHSDTQPSSGGQSGSGGQTGSGGSTGGAVGVAGAIGSPPTDCGNKIDFHVTFAGPESARYCPGPATACAPVTGFSIADAAGAGLGPAPGCSQADCATCQAPGCINICVWPTPVPTEGEQFSWTGFKWEGGHVCANGPQCSTPICAEPGSYVARYCAYPIDADAGTPDIGSPCQNASSTPICVEAAFEYPGTTLVEMVVDPANPAP